MKTARHMQPKLSRRTTGGFSLPVSAGSAPSPYFQRRSAGKTDVGRVTLTLNLYMRIIAQRWDSNTGGKLFFSFKLLNGATEVADTAVLVTVSGVTTALGLRTAGLAALDTWLSGNGYDRNDGIIWPFLDEDQVLALVGGAASYQTIVSQSSTSAPAVSDGDDCGAVGCHTWTTRIDCSAY